MCCYTDLAIQIPLLTVHGCFCSMYDVQVCIVYVYLWYYFDTGGPSVLYYVEQEPNPQLKGKHINILVYKYL
jgi:hypothetical protein